MFSLAIGVLSLLVHFEIYRRTSASAIVNQPELYFGDKFIIRDSEGQSIGEVSAAIGFASYLTAFLALAGIAWGASLIRRNRR